MSYTPHRANVISTLNSTATPLAANGVYSGSAEDVTDFSSIFVTAYSLPQTNSGSLFLQFSQDATTWIYTDHIHLTGSVAIKHELAVQCKYFRATFENLDGAQDSLAIQTILSVNSKRSTTRLNSSVGEHDPSTVVKSLTVGKYPSRETYGDIFITENNELTTDVAKTAFGETQIAEMTPVVQADSVYGLNPATVQTLVSGSGTAVSESNVRGNLFSVSTGIQANSYARIRTVKTIRNRPGQGCICRMTALFSSGANDSEQFIGAERNGQGFGFGFSGSMFGTFHITNGAPEIRQLLIPTEVTATQLATVILNGSGTNMNVSGNALAVAYQISSASFADWISTNISTSVYFMSKYTRRADGAYGITMNGMLTGTFFSLGIGSEQINNFRHSSSWNTDKMDGTGPSGMKLQPGYGNVYQVKYQWLGYGLVEYFIENSETGRLCTVDVLKYGNSNFYPSLQNPTLNPTYRVNNYGNTSDLIVRGASMGGFIEGKIQPFTEPRSFLYENTALGSTMTCIFSIKNRFEMNRVPNGALLRPITLSVSADGARTVQIWLIVNASLGGQPTWYYLDENISTALYDVSGTSVSSGRQILATTIGKTESKIVDITNYNIVLGPGETISVVAKTPAQTTDFTAGLSWFED